MFEEIIDSENINQALEYLLNGKDTCGIDGMYIHELKEYLDNNKEQLIRLLDNGKWVPGMVRLVDTVNKKGKIRKISTMNSVDKLVARCIFQVLEPTVEESLSEYSFAYRKEKGVDAAVLKAREYAEEEPYVAAVDFVDFFDSVDHIILADLIHERFDDVKLENLILKFLHLEILENGMVTRMNRGILQGSSISPLLSNFYLDPFDRYLETRGYHFVRYSDDCRIFAGNRKEGERILKDVTSWVETHLRLHVHPEKSRVELATNINFFGKVLKHSSNGLIITKKDRKPGEWYSEWTPSALSFSNGIYHIREDGILSAKDRAILFENEEIRKFYPIENVYSINVFGNTIFDKSFFSIMNSRHIDVVMFDQMGRYIGTFMPAASASDMGLLIKQVQIYDNEKRRVFYAKSITVAGIRNMVSTIRYYNKHRPLLKFDQAEEIIKKEIHSIRKTKTIEEVMASEARCRQEYYDCYNDFIFNNEFSFPARSRRPPKDPVNAMISFGNVYLYNRLSSLITRSGLDNRISFVHSSMRRKNNLCLDLADIYKPIIVDRVVLTLVNKRMINPEIHFIYEEDSCLMNEEGVKIFVKEMKRKLGQKHQINGKSTSYLRIMKDDITQLAKCIKDDIRFEPFVGE